MWKLWLMFCMSLGTALRAQTAPAALPPLSLKDAIEGARRYGGQIQSASLAAQIAHQDTVQARAGLLPTLTAFNQIIYTEGNGTASGVFVANDGVHVYNEQALVHEDLFSPFRRADLRRAKAAEAVAAARRDVAQRGLDATVVKDFYAVVTAARKVTTAQTSLQDAARFLDITQKQERGGEAAKADVIKAKLQQQQRQRDLADAHVAYEQAKVTLAVLVFPDVTRDFSAVDDLDSAPSLIDYPEIEGEAARSSPEVRAAQAGIEEAHQEVSAARYQYLPGLAFDFAYGIDANQLAARTGYPTAESGRSTLPDYQVPYRQNLGYSGQVTLNIPLWNWGATRSKVAQAQLREEQAKVDLGVARKQVRANILSYYLEARAARDQIESLRGGQDLAAESLRLGLLRYQAGEATAFEVADAQSTLAAARNAYADGLARYRVALGNLQALTGRF